MLFCGKSKRSRHFSPLWVFLLTMAGCILCSLQGAVAQEEFFTWVGETVILTLSREEIAVKFKPAITNTAIYELNTRQGVSETDVFEDGSLRVLRARKEGDIQSVREMYSQHPYVQYANPVYYRSDLPVTVRFTFDDKLLVRVKNEAPDTVLNRLNKQYATERVWGICGRDVHIEVLRVSAPLGFRLLQIARIYSQVDAVENAGPNWMQLDIIENQVYPNDPYFAGDENRDGYPDQWGFHQGDNDPYPDCDIDAPLAWEISQGVSPVKIAILDRGIFYHGSTPDADLIHWDFKTIFPSYKLKVVHESEWFNALNGEKCLIDPDCNCSLGECTFNPECEYPLNNAYDEIGHGTSVSGIAAAAVNNVDEVSDILGIAGIAWSYDIKIMPVKMQPYSELRICLALEHAMQHGAKVVNMSWSWVNDPGNIGVSLDKAYEVYDILLVSSSGNYVSWGVLYPATHPCVMAVGATIEEDKRWSSSSYGPELDVVAPGGHNICAPTNYGSWTWNFGGTSASSPLAAGLAALVRSYDSGLTNAQVWEVMCRSAEKVRKDVYSYNQTKEYGKWNNEMGYGRVNAFWALLQAGAGKKGDMNRDMAVDVLDTFIMFDIIMEYIEPDDYEQWAGDLNYDGEINIIDYQLLWDIIMGERGGRSLPEIASEPAIVYLSKIPGSSGEYEIMLDSSVGVAGVQLWISYNPQAWTPGEPQTTDRSAVLELHHRNEDGELMVMLASPTGDEIASGSGPFVYVYSQKPGGSLHITRAILCTATGQEIPVVIRRMGSPKSVDQPLPNTFMLSQNYPNPFNPETQIEYALPEGTCVNLTVYNILGQVVEVLVDSKQQAGYHEVQWNGEGVASGIYFYRLTAGEFSEIRHMLLTR